MDDFGAEPHPNVIAREREEIVAKYDLGREPGAVIPDWEDPNIPEYVKKDDFGFYHEQNVPETSLQLKRKRDNIKNNRETKWRKMILEWDKKYAQSEKLFRRVFKGIPSTVRGSVWMKLLDAERSKNEHRGSFSQLRDIARRESPDIRQIDLDVNRTFRNHEMFKDRFGPRQKELFHVLAAFSIFNTEVGYCQGMSHIAAILLMFVATDEEAFWCLTNLFVDKKHALHGFFIPNFPKVSRFQNHLDLVLKKFLPKLREHLRNESVDYNLFTIKWFLQCFLDQTPFSLTMRLWDIYMLIGDRLLIAMAYNILKMHKKNLLKMHFDQIVSFLLHTLAIEFGYDDDEVIRSLQECMEELKRAKLDTVGPTPAEETPKRPFGLAIIRSQTSQRAARQRVIPHPEYIDYIDANSGTQALRETPMSASVHSTSRADQMSTSIRSAVLTSGNSGGSHVSSITVNGEASDAMPLSPTGMQVKAMRNTYRSSESSSKVGPPPSASASARRTSDTEALTNANMSRNSSRPSPAHAAGDRSFIPAGSTPTGRLNQVRGRSESPDRRDDVSSVTTTATQARSLSTLVVSPLESKNSMLVVNSSHRKSATIWVTDKDDAPANVTNGAVIMTMSNSATISPYDNVVRTDSSSLEMAVYHRGLSDKNQVPTAVAI